MGSAAASRVATVPGVKAQNNCIVYMELINGLRHVAQLDTIWLHMEN